MPFLGACPFCPTKMKLPDHALGASIRCPKCGNYFTAVPQDDIPAAKKPGHRGAPVGTRAASTRSVPDEAPPPETDQPAVSNATEAPADDVNETPSTPAPEAGAPDRGEGEPRHSPLATVPPPGYPSPKPVPDWVNVWGLAGVLLTGVGLSFAALGLPRFLTILLAGLGLAVSALGFLATEKRKPKDNLWLFPSGILGLIALALALFWPHVLNRWWTMRRPPPAADMSTQLLVSRDNQVVGGPASPSHWADARKTAIRQGDVHIRLEEVKIAPAPVAGEIKDPAVLTSLLITVRISNAGHLRRVDFEGFAKNPPVLRDDQGKVLAQRRFGPELKAVGPLARAFVPPTRFVKDLLIFESPKNEPAYLDLELPAAAWHGQGTCKFRIDRSWFTASPP
jgi:hypothetical protein